MIDVQKIELGGKESKFLELERKLKKLISIEAICRLYSLPAKYVEGNSKYSMIERVAQ